MMIEYINTAIENAEYKKLEDGTWFVEIPGYEGVWANGDNIEACRRELMEVLEEWLLLKIKDNNYEASFPYSTSLSNNCP
jgi:predicted RNase H-like HicB family nuclease